MERLSVTRLKAVRRCDRLHHIVYDEGYKSLVVAEELAFGDLMHEGQEAWWTVLKLAPGEASPVALEAALLTIATVPCPDPMCESCPPDEACPTCAGRKSVARPADPFMLAAARATMVAYDQRWLVETAQRFRVLAVERRFEIPLVNPSTGAESRTFRVHGKIDVDTLRDGLPTLVEHKTSKEDIAPGSRFVRRLRMDSQTAIYLDGANTSPPVVEIPAGGGAPSYDTVVYDVIGKPGLRPLKATPEEDRKYTKPKLAKCPACKGKRTGCKLVRSDAAEVADEALHARLMNGEEITCTDGKVLVEASHLYSNQRDRDETPDEYGARVYQLLQGEPDRYFQRHDVVRFAEEMDAHRADTWARSQMILEARRRAAAAPTAAAKLAAFPRNPDACEDYGRPCEFLDVCSGVATLQDVTKYVRRPSFAPEGATPEPAVDPSVSKEAP
jgi:hypothetical protein